MAKTKKQATAEKAAEEEKERAVPMPGKKSGKKTGEKAKEPGKRAKIEKPARIKKIQEMIKKKKHPVFRGRFGKRKIRNASKKKWDKWRKPRGIDIVKRKEDGSLPDTGFRTPLAIRFRHPSGYYTRIVNNARELEALSTMKETAAIIASNVGERKRKDILKRAVELKIVVLNV